MLELRMKIPVNYQILQVFFSSFNYWQEIKQIAHFFATSLNFLLAFRACFAPALISDVKAKNLCKNM